MVIASFKRTFKFINQHPFASRHLLSAYFKFFKWQFQTMFNKGLIPKTFMGDIMFYGKKGLAGITGNIYCGLHEFEDMSFLLHFLRKEDIFFDIGANVGSYTLLASGVVKCKTLCFEPSLISYDILLKNILINKLDVKVQAYNFAIGSVDGYLNFTENEDTSNRVVSESDSVSWSEVKVTKLDNFSADIPRLLKIDVEGFETEVLNGAHSILSNPKLKAIAIELNGSGKRYGFDENQIHIKLTELGFTPYKYQPFIRKLIPLQIYTEYDTIYLRDITFVEKRLSESKTFKLWYENI